jgi:hypothetical protein
VSEQTPEQALAELDFSVEACVSVVTYPQLHARAREALDTLERAIRELRELQRRISTG